MPRLFVLSGADLGKVHSFDGKVRLGRTSDCEVVVHGSSISRVHAELIPEGETWVLADLDSSNGVHLGSIRAKRFELSDGDVFCLGKVELRFRLDDAAPAAFDPVDQAAVPPPAPGESAPAPIEVAAEDPDDDELFLEEDIDLGEASEAPSSPPPTLALKVGAGVGDTEPRSEESEERLRTLRAAAQRRTADVTDRREREILQFSSYRPESSAMTSDLSQHPLWVRILAILLVLGVSATVFWFAFRGASSIRGTPEIVLEEDV